MRALCLAALLLLAACAPSSPDPRETAQAFWEAVGRGDLEEARLLASSTSAAEIEDWQPGLEIREVVLAEPLTNDAQALVETSLVSESDGRALPLVLDTHLVREAGAWRVDVHRTREELTRALIAAGVEQVERAVAVGVQEFGRALEEGAREFERAMREALEELEQPAPPAPQR